MSKDAPSPQTKPAAAAALRIACAMGKVPSPVPIPVCNPVDAYPLFPGPGPASLLSPRTPSGSKDAGETRASANARSAADLPVPGTPTVNTRSGGGASGCVMPLVSCVQGAGSSACKMLLWRRARDSENPRHDHSDRDEQHGRSTTTPGTLQKTLRALSGHQVACTLLRGGQGVPAVLHDGILQEGTIGLSPGYIVWDGRHALLPDSTELVVCIRAEPRAHRAAVWRSRA